MSDQHIIVAKCTAHAFESRNAVQYFPGLEYQIDLADKYQRKLVWLKTQTGKWIFQFDRADSSSTAHRIFFCKECGQPFDRLSEIGTHTRSQHNKTKATVDNAQAANADEEEERLLAERRAAEEAEEVVEAVK